MNMKDCIIQRLNIYKCLDCHLSKQNQENWNVLKGVKPDNFPGMWTDEIGDSVH